MMKMRILLLAAMVPVAGAARAQDASGGGAIGASTAVPANISVAERARPDYAPIGGRIGSFFLYPRLELTGLYDSNLLATRSNTLSDEAVLVRPSVQLVSNWSRNQLQLNVFYQREIQANYSSENIGQYGGDGSAVFYVTPTTTLTLGTQIARLTEPRTDINSNNTTLSPISYTNLVFDAGVTQSFAAFQLVANGSVAKQSFSDAVMLDGTPLLQGFRDNTAVNVSLEGRYRVGAGTSILAHVGRQSITYDQNPLAGFDRNSNALRAELGVGLAFTRLLYGDVRIGYFKQSNNDARFTDSSGLSFSANVLYSLTPLTSIRLTADRSIEPGGSTVTSGNVRSTGTVTIEHELRHNIVLTAYGRYANIDPQAATIVIGNAEEYEGRVGAEYFLNRRFRLNANVTQFMRRGHYYPSIDQTLGSVGLVITL